MFLWEEGASVGADLDLLNFPGIMQWLSGVSTGCSEPQNSHSTQMVVFILDFLVVFEKIEQARWNMH